MAVTRVVTGNNDGSNPFNDQSSGTSVNNNASSIIRRKTEDSLIEKGKSGYSHSGAFAGKPTDNNYVWQAGAGISYTQANVDAELFTDHIL